MNKVVTSKEAILEACKSLVVDAGMKSLNMREVAKRSGVAVGSVYNYFPSKEDLQLATVESIWTEILAEAPEKMTSASFIEAVGNLFEKVQSGSKKYPLFLIIHAMSFIEGDKKKGREIMIRFFGQIENRLLAALESDPNVRQGAFTDAFTKRELASFVFSNIRTSVTERKDSCRTLLEVIKRAVY